MVLFLQSVPTITMYKYKCRCSVPGCIFPRKDFVEDDKKLKNWLNSLENDSLRSKSLNELSKLRLCLGHFEARFVNLSSISFLNKANTTREVCRICLCSEISMVHEVDPVLIEFLEELLYYDTIEYSNIGMCIVCEHQLRRFYNFRQRCRRAHIVLKNTDKDSLEQKKQQLPQLSLDICNAKSNQIVVDVLVPGSDSEISFENQKSCDPTEMHKPENQPTCTKMHKNQNGKNLNAETNSDSNKLDNSNGPVQSKNTLYTYQIVGKNTKILEIVGRDAKSQQLEGQNTKYLQIVGKDAKNQSIPPKPMKSLEIVPKIAKSQQIMVKNKKKLPRVRKTIVKKKYGRKLTLTQLKEKVTDLIDKGEFSDIEELGVKMSKEVFLNIIEKCTPGALATSKVLKNRAGVPLIRAFLKRLLQHHNPMYDEVFDIQYLRTLDEKVAEFNSRQYSKAYIEAQNRCELCFKVFDAQGLMDLHNKCHDPNLPYACDICPMRYKNKLNHFAHRYANHTWVYQCKLCIKRTYTVAGMREHYLSHKGFTFNCDTCGRRFHNKSSIGQHIKNKHSNQRNCAHCGEFFKSLPKYSAHFASNHADVDEATLPPPQFKCEKCCLYFYNSEALLNHKGRHERELKQDCVDDYLCFFCKKRFNSLHALRQHKVTAEHSRSRNLRKIRTCPLCHEEIDTRGWHAMYNHFKSVHPAAPFIAGRSLLCEQCGQAFENMSEYEAHHRAHRGEVPVECECGKPLVEGKTHVHIKHNTSVQCHLCDKVVAYSANLKRHMRVHTGEKPYECSICLKRFTQSNSMKLHMLTVHEGQKAPYRYREGKRGYLIPKKVKVRLNNLSDRTDMENDEEIENRGRERRAKLAQHTPNYAELSSNDEYFEGGNDSDSS